MVFQKAAPEAKIATQSKFSIGAKPTRGIIFSQLRVFVASRGSSEILEVSYIHSDDGDIVG